MTTKLKAQDILKNKENEPTISAVELAELQKAAKRAEDLEKAAREAQEAADNKIAELTKSLEDEKQRIEDFEKAKAQEDMEDLVKGFTFIGEGEQKATVEALLKARNVEGAEVILATFEKAQKAIDDFATVEHGADLQGDDLEKTAAEKANEDFDSIAAKIMKSRKGAK